MTSINRMPVSPLRDRSAGPLPPLPAVRVSALRRILRGPDACRAAAKVLANGRGDLKPALPLRRNDAFYPAIKRDTRMREDSGFVGPLAMWC